MGPRRKHSKQRDSAVSLNFLPLKGKKFATKSKTKQRISGDGTTAKR
jgi:hypothetical protein